MNEPNSPFIHVGEISKVIAAIDLNFALDMKKGFWEIKTAEPRRFSSIKNKTLIWEAAKHTSNGRRYRPN